MHRPQSCLFRQCLTSRIQLRHAAPPCQRLRQRQHASLTVLAARNPYEVLGVGRSASLADVKRAYRKKALQLHPDVNTAADAKDRFMECKNAYQDIVQRGERSTRQDASSPSPAGRAGWGGGGSSSANGGGQRSSQPQEEFYGLDELLGNAVEGVRSGAERAWGLLGDLFRDVEKEWDSYSSRRRRDEAAGPKSLWEELADVGEELVEFLEKGVGLSEGDAATGNRAEDVYDRYKQQHGDGSSSGSSSSSSSGGQSVPRQDPASAGPQTTGGKPGGNSGGDRRSRATPSIQKSREEAIDEDLKELKRKMGLE